MTDAPTPQAAPAPAPAEAGSFFQNLLDMYFAPREAFARIVRAPRILLPLVLYAACVMGFTAIWLHKVDPAEFAKTQIEESGRADKMTAEQKQAAIDMQSRMMGTISSVVIPLFIAVMLLVVSGTLMFVFRFFYSGEVTFKQSLAIVVWTFLAVGLISTPVILTVLTLKGDWNVDPNQVVQANLGLLLDKSTAAKPLWALFTSIDAFVLWIVFLLAAGFGVACKRKTASALWGVAIPWLVIVGIKVAAAAVF
jgi:hypothetical protein